MHQTAPSAPGYFSGRLSGCLSSVTSLAGRCTIAAHRLSRRSAYFPRWDLLTAKICLSLLYPAISSPVLSLVPLPLPGVWTGHGSPDSLLNWPSFNYSLNVEVIKHLDLLVWCLLFWFISFPSLSLSLSRFVFPNLKPVVVSIVSSVVDITSAGRVLLSSALFLTGRLERVISFLMGSLYLTSGLQVVATKCWATKCWACVHREMKRCIWLF